MNTRKRVVWFHYNKPYSQRYKVDKWSVHFGGKCYIVDNIICKIPTFSKNNKRQPRVVMKGYAEKVIEENGQITIV